MVTSELVQLFIADLTDYAIVVLDVQGRVLTWNAGARALLGYAEDEIVGRRVSELYAQSNGAVAEPSASLKDALAWGRHETTGRLVRKNGSFLEAQIVLRPLSDGQQKFVGFGMLAYEVGRSKPVLAEVTRPQGAKVVPIGGSAKILVVDDDNLVRQEAVQQLTSLGYDVVAASSGAEALAMLESVADIDLLFTDVVMPGGIAGRALADKAAELRPGLRVLFASGYFEGALVGKGDLDTDVQFLVKPYRKRELAQKVEEVLKSGS